MPVETKKSDKIKAILSDKKKISIIAASVLGIALLGVGAYMIANNLKTTTEPTGTISNVFRGTIQNYISGNGKTSALLKEELGLKLEGEVTEVLVKAGDSVSAGDVLVKVSTDAMREKLNDASDAYDVALSNLKALETQYNNLVITAPFTGKIIKVSENTVGSQVVTDSVFATIVDDSKMTLTTYFSYGYVDTIKVGQTAVISIPATTSNINGVVSSVEKIKKVSPDDGSILFKVVTEITNPGALTKDMVASAIIKTPSGDVLPAETGKLDYLKTQDIVVKASGELTKKNANEHYVYNKGDVLAVISSDDILNKLNSARRDVDTSFEKVSELTALLETATITSPIDGLITQVSVNVDDKLTGSQSSPVVTVANLTQLVVDVRISEIDITKAEIGMPVTLTYESTDGVNYLNGVLSHLSLEAEVSQNQTQSYMSYFPAKITIDDPQNLRPDMNVQYKISAVTREDVLVVPVNAVIQTEQGYVLYVSEGSVSPEFNTVPIVDPSIPKGYIGVVVEIGISDGFNTELLTEIPDGSEIYVPNSTSIPTTPDMDGGDKYEEGFSEAIPMG